MGRFSAEPATAPTETTESRIGTAGCPWFNLHSEAQAQTFCTCKVETG